MFLGALFPKDASVWELCDTPPKVPGVKIHDRTIAFSGKKKKELTCLITKEVSENVIRFSFHKNTQVALKILLFDLKKEEQLQFHFRLGSGAEVTVDHIFLEPINSKLSIERKFRLKENARLTLLTGVFPNASFLCRDDTELIGEGASVDYLSLAVATKKNRIQIEETVRHQAKQTISKMQNFLIATEEGLLECIVAGVIQKGMAQSVCEQANRGLLLGEKSSISVDPKLLIDEYDVKASHGAAIGRINDDELFYLESRGLDETLAKQLIVFGYLAPFLDQLAHAKLSDYLTKIVRKQVMGGAIDEPELA
ncbi:MAG: SufD family Fe-S cluster assembly protein [Candidatus Izemoplasmatales bacterium]